MRFCSLLPRRHCRSPPADAEPRTIPCTTCSRELPLARSLRKGACVRRATVLRGGCAHAPRRRNTVTRGMRTCLADAQHSHTGRATLWGRRGDEPPLHCASSRSRSRVESTSRITKPSGEIARISRPRKGPVTVRRKTFSENRATAEIHRIHRILAKAMTTSTPRSSAPAIAKSASRVSRARRTFRGQGLHRLRTEHRIARARRRQRASAQSDHRDRSASDERSSGLEVSRERAVRSASRADMALSPNRCSSRVARRNFIRTSSARRSILSTSARIRAV